MQQRTLRSGPYVASEQRSSSLLVVGLLAFVLAAVTISVFALLAGRATDAPPDPLVPEGAHVRGQPDAPLTMVLFGDFQCADCGAFARDVLPRLNADFIDAGRARYAYRHLPTMGRESLRAALASECAARQGKFWRYVTVLHGWQSAANAGNFSDELLEQFALGIRLDTGEFRDCLASGATAGPVERDIAQAEALGIRAAPALFINGVLVEGPIDYDRVRAEIMGRAAEG